MAPPPRADDLKAQRVRQLLSNYYGSDTASNASEGSQGSSTPPRSQHRDAASDPGAKTDLDSKDFSVDKYLETLLREARLEKLLSSSTGMSSDIKSLDADMQRLVYENYNRFITATDTIRDLKTNLDAASPSMPKLQQTSEEIERCREAVRSKLQQRQSQVADLNEVQGLLVKLESVFQLPQRLRVAIDACAYALAVDCYISARPVLKRAGYKGTLRRVAAEVEVQVKELTALLKEQVVAQRPAAVECIGLIRRLGGPVADLQDEFLRCMRESVRVALDAAQQAMAEPGGADARSAPDMKSVLDSLHSAFFPELMRNSQLFTDLFERSSRPALIRVCRELLASYQGLVKRILESMATTSAAAAASAAVTSSSPADSGAATDWGVEPIMEALQQVVLHLGQLHPLLPELSLQDRAAETSEKCVRHHIHACVLALRDEIWSIITGSVAQERPVVLQQRAASALQGGTRALLLSLQQYGSSPAAAGSWKEAFTELLQGSLQKLIVSLVQQFMAAAGSDMQELGVVGLADPVATTSPSSATSGAEPASTRLLLFLTSFSLTVRDEAVPATAALLDGTFPRAAAAAVGVWFDATLLTRMLDQAFRRLLQRYMEAHSAPMVQAMCSEIRSGPSDQEPRGCRAFCGAWGRTLTAAAQELTALQEDVHGGRGRYTGDIGLNTLPGAGGHESPLTTSAVLPGIIAPALDALVETVRLQTLSKGALHQVQVDACALKELFLRHLATYAAISTLSTLEKVVIAASERCLDPVLLSAAAVEKVAAQTAS
mmetsp:Transcript_7242/g.21340  ORF Transcript_7242/g.21340 Transcript_7242/m.21340 type:complete len:777 (-) Transcript_7242:454-2784(-)